MNTHVFLITAKTNLHVGNESGGEFTIIDKAIQRDALTELPCINSSSLKGAINEYCCFENQVSPNDRIRLFGSDKKDKKDFQKGEAIFFDAKLLLLPQQNDTTLYNYITSNKVIEMMNERVKLFDPDFKFETPAKHNNVAVEVKSNDNFSKQCDNDNLPIIARNVLENGVSVNLWYEQVLPSESVLFTIIREEGETLKNALNNKIVQIGANATIGYGYCKFELLKTISSTK